MILNYLGNFALILFNNFTINIYYLNIKFKQQNFLKKKLNELKFFKFFFAMLSFLSLIVLFINSEFSNETVLNNSHISKPLFYKISGTWGNHEGSLLLWLLVLTFFAFFYYLNSKNRPTDERLLTIFFKSNNFKFYFFL